MQFREKRTKNIQLDITPIVDMVFNLLIFFALSINFSAPSTMNLVLPKISAPVSAQQAPVIQISRNLNIVFDRSPIGFDDLADAVVGLRRRSSGSGIIIMADESVHHGFVISVMDICRQAGYDKISISARVQQ